MGSQGSDQDIRDLYLRNAPSVGGDEIWEAVQSRFPASAFLPKRASAPKRRTGLHVAVYASVAVVLVAAVAVGGIVAAQYLGRPQFVLAITDDNVVGAGAQSGQWERLPLTAEGEDPAVSSILVDPDTPSTLYATTKAGIYRSTNAGTNWTLILEGNGSVVLAPSMPSRLYALTDAGLFRSDDSGTNWTQLNGAGLLAEDRTGIYGQLALVLANQPDTLFAVSESAVWSPFYLYRSTDAGNSWQRTDVEVSDGVGNMDVFRVRGGVVADPQHASTIYALIGSDANKGGDGHVYHVAKTTDAGAAWTDLAPAEWDVPVVGLSVDPHDPNIVWAIQNGLSDGEHSVIRRSTDGGATWEKVELEGTANRIMSIVFDPQSANTLYAYNGGTSYWDGTLHRSTDGGATWENIGENIPGWLETASLVPDPAPGGALYAATEGGLFKWMPTTQAVTTTSTAALPPTTSTTVPVAMSKAEIAQWKTDAIAFNDRFYGAWPDADATFTQFADDAAFYDPSNGDFLIEGKKAANRLIVDTIWPPWVPEPANHAPVGTLEVFGFRNGQVTRYEEWFWAATLEMLGYGVFAPGKGGSEQLQKIADRYVAAWSSGDKARIAALYNKDATFSDTMRGLHAQGPGDIAELAGKRFGSAGKTAFEVIDLYVQTNGPDPPTEQLPKQGAIIGVGIHYRCNLVMDGKSATVEGLTTFELGTRQGSTFAPDPNGLITREEVFYDADSLLASGLVR
jgi:photosystem II stability/assembly factor-like uncharacterized protein